MTIELQAAASAPVSSASDQELEFELPTANSPDLNDVHAFEKALFHDPFAENVFSKIESVSGSLSEMKVDFEKSLKKAADSAQPSDILDSMRKLSEYTLQTSMIAKAAGKTSQAVEKLTNLS